MELEDLSSEDEAMPEGGEAAGAADAGKNLRVNANKYLRTLNAR